MTSKQSDPQLKLLISSEEIATRITQLAEQIDCEYVNRELTIVGIMSGAILFVADLIRLLHCSVRLETLNASSYRGASTTPGNLMLNTDSLPPLENQHLLVVDDILDTGRTLRAVSRELVARNPASLKSAVLLWKSDRTESGTTSDYFGFEIPDEFVVGYGLDHNGLYRNLPDIRVLSQEE